MGTPPDRRLLQSLMFNETARQSSAGGVFALHELGSQIVLKQYLHVVGQVWWDKGATAPFVFSHVKFLQAITELHCSEV